MSNTNKLFVDGVWVEKKRNDLEDLVLRKFCKDEMTFEEFTQIYNRFLKEEGVEYSPSLYYTEDVIRTRTNRLSDSRVVLWNGPMEGFWGILKRERYYGKRFTSRESLAAMIENYICYYNFNRLQRNLGVLTPMQKHCLYKAA